MKDDSLSDVVQSIEGRGEIEIKDIGKPVKIVGIEKAYETNVYEKEIWNEAIEAAAKVCSNRLSSDAVRMLKK